jgi:hypothetical protein
VQRWLKKIIASLMLALKAVRVSAVSRYGFGFPAFMLRLPRSLKNNTGEYLYEA